MNSRLCYGCMETTDQSVCPHCGYPQGGTNQPHQLPTGTLLRGQYVIGRVLGQGGFGITYLGWDRYLDMKVAIKEFYPSAIVSRDCTHNLGVSCTTDSMTGAYHSSRERFLREAKALAKFEGSSAIVGIKSFFEENNTAYIIMEYVKGTSLERYIGMRGGRISPEEAFRLLQPIMDALARVHEAGMVHRDISPDNIILHPMGGAKLLDFGAVRDVGDGNAMKSTEAILKHGFAPLEQYQSRGELGAWTDVYALCATIWYCVTGQVPMDAPARIMEDTPLAWESIPGLTEHQRKVLHKGTALRAKDRYASVGQLRHDLLQSQATAPEPAPQPDAVKKAEPAPVQKSATVQKPQPSGSQDWICSCGYKNKRWHASCQSCGTSRPVTNTTSKSASPRPQAPASSDWYCSCGYRNKSWHASCQSCGTSRPRPATASKPAAPARRETGFSSAAEMLDALGIKK